MRAILELNSDFDPKEGLTRAGWLAPEITEEERSRTFHKVREKVVPDDYARFDATFRYTIGRARSSARGTVCADEELLPNMYLVRMVDDDPSLLLGNVERLVRDVRRSVKAPRLGKMRRARRPRVVSVTVAEGSDKTPVVVGHVLSNRSVGWHLARRLSEWVVVVVTGGLGVLLEVISLNYTATWAGIFERVSTGLLTTTFAGVLALTVEIIRAKRSPDVYWEAARRPNVD